MQKYIKNILRCGTTTLIISNDEMEDIIKIVKSLEESGLLSIDQTESEGCVIREGN